MDTQRSSDDAQAVPIHDWDCSGHETLACQYPGCGLSPWGDRAAWLARHAGPMMDFNLSFTRASHMSGEVQVWQGIARRLYTVLKQASFETNRRDTGFEVAHRIYAHHRLEDICLTCSALEAFESMPQVIDDDFSEWVDHGGEG